MESLEISARTVNEAIELALARLGKSREELDISVLSEGSKGILGIGHEDARILVSVRPPAAGGPKKALPEALGEAPEEALEEAPTDQDVSAVAKGVLEDILSAMGYDDTTVEIKQVGTHGGEAPAVVLDIEGDDLGALIGRRGETLTSLQFIVNLIVARRLRRWSRIVVDVEGYRNRREDTLRGLAERMAERVGQTRRPIALEAMPANERRIIHIALQSHPTVTTESTGEGDHRKVVIMPRSGR